MILVHQTNLDWYRFSVPHVGPVVTSPFTKKASSNVTSRAVPSSCAKTVTPACLQDLYGIPTTLATQSTNQLGVSGFIEQFANQADLKVCLVKITFVYFRDNND